MPTSLPRSRCCSTRPKKTYASIIPGILKDVVSPVVLVGELSYGIRTLLADYPSYQQADEATKRGFEAQSLAVNMAQVQKKQAEPWVKVAGDYFDRAKT